MFWFELNSYWFHDNFRNTNVALLFSSKNIALDITSEFSGLEFLGPSLLIVYNYINEIELNLHEI